MQILNRFALLLDRHPVVFAHLMMALGALLLGAWVLWGRKGTTLHRSLGWTWVALMTGVAVSGAFIRDYHLPNLYGFTPIHLFVLMVAWQLPRAVVYARSGRIDAHRKAMRGLYQGGCLIAGVLTLLPGRFLGTMLWRQLGLMT
ncbi:MAG: DUF2306 domain-containing protein [Burkholderiaceae bacterium]|nr:DUF2306 domain-containing protein [Rhodoferax sp.]MCP5283388.1 DUF2306 domain-containing protein [Burkholderiaceae bacterium]